MRIPIPTHDHVWASCNVLSSNNNHYDNPSLKIISVYLVIYSQCPTNLPSCPCGLHVCIITVDNVESIAWTGLVGLLARIRLLRSRERESEVPFLASLQWQADVKRISNEKMSENKLTIFFPSCRDRPRSCVRLKRSADVTGLIQCVYWISIVIIMIMITIVIKAILVDNVRYVESEAWDRAPCTIIFRGQYPSIDRGSTVGSSSSNSIWLRVFQSQIWSYAMWAAACETQRSALIYRVVLFLT